MSEDSTISEIDNCPRCNATVILSHGFEKGAYQPDFDEAEPEVQYGVCKICDTRFRRQEQFRSGKRIAVYAEWTGGVWLELLTKDVPVDLSMCDLETGSARKKQTS